MTRRVDLIEQLLTLEDYELDRLHNILRSATDLATIVDAQLHLKTFYRIFRQYKDTPKELAEQCDEHFYEIISAIDLIDDFLELNL